MAEVSEGLVILLPLRRITRNPPRLTKSTTLPTTTTVHQASSWMECKTLEFTQLTRRRGPEVVVGSAGISSCSSSPKRRRPSTTSTIRTKSPRLPPLTLEFLQVEILSFHPLELAEMGFNSLVNLVEALISSRSSTTFSRASWSRTTS